MNKNKLIAPIIITVIMIIYFVIYFGFLITLIDGIFKYLLGILPLIFIGVIVFVCVERIKEIGSGEEDDLSKY